MPELPEVEHAMQQLRAALEGQLVERIVVRHAALRRGLSASDARRLTGRRVVSVTRRAKLQLITFDDGQLLTVHFRMNGDWDFGCAEDPQPPYERARITTEDGLRVSLVDSRALSVLTRHAAGDHTLPNMGPEPLGDDFTVAAFAAALGTRKAPIKPVLMDQGVVAGLGNIYASESLWEARIHPITPARRLSIARVTRLRESIRIVLRRAQGARYHAPSTTSSPPEFQVYHAEGTPCPRGDGGVIRRIVQGGRGTYYCPRCQH